jgi:hypothetical protein
MRENVVLPLPLSPTNEIMVGFSVISIETWSTAAI